MTVRTLTKGEQTRERILDLAEDAVLHKGFALTSIDELIAAAGITKSGFFYHFRDKNDLAKALLERYLERDEVIFDDLFAKADALNEDPLHGFLVFLKLLADLMSDLTTGHPGCLVASYCYQDRLFSSEIRELGALGVRRWRARFRQRLDLIAERYPPKIEVNLDVMADMLSAVIDGGIILSKSLAQPKHLPEQVMIYRSFVRLVFLGSRTNPQVEAGRAAEGDQARS
jgi:TetR/AcrR family transcriptional regulator, transcriptional repressor for nem operon